MLFSVLTGSTRGANGNRAVNMQTQQQHDSYLDIRHMPEYKTVMLMPPGPQKVIAIAKLKEMAALNERTNVPEYWYDDQVPRRDVPMASSWVSPIQYDPRTHVMTVNGYSYANVSPNTISRILNGHMYVHKPGSIGSAMNKFYRGGR